MEFRSAISNSHLACILLGSKSINVYYVFNCQISWRSGARGRRHLHFKCASRVLIHPSYSHVCFEHIRSSCAFQLCEHSCVTILFFSFLLANPLMSLIWCRIGEFLERASEEQTQRSAFLCWGFVMGSPGQIKTVLDILSSRGGVLNLVGFWVLTDRHTCLKDPLTHVEYSH